MSERLRISTEREELREGLFGQVFLWVFEILPYLDGKGIFPAWAIRSPLYGDAETSVVIPGLLELNYDPSADQYVEANLLTLRERHVASLGNDWDYTAALWRTYFRWPQRVCARAEEFGPLGKALGIHYRGTDKNQALEETNYVSPDDFLVLVRDFVETHSDIDSIYVASDENAFVDRVRAQHPSLRIVNSGKVAHHKDPALSNAHGKGDHALLDCLLLSRCRYLVKCQSALSGFAKILNPKLQAYRVSANKLAHWSCGVPYFPDAYLPQLESRNPECQRILARLFAGDWTQDRLAAKRYSRKFQFKPRKGYMRKSGTISKWSWDGLHERIDRRMDAIARQLPF
jgi:hypothetical protein